VSVLLYHIVCPIKYRKAVLTETVNAELRTVCLEISQRYEIHFIEIGTDNDHVHFLVQSVPLYSAKELVQIIKSIIAREIFRRLPSVKEELWRGQFWTSGYFVNTVSRRGSENAIPNYVKSQGKPHSYHQIQKSQLSLFNH
jgi:REP element-mobilizing transposase RayT